LKGAKTAFPSDAQNQLRIDRAYSDDGFIGGGKKSLESGIWHRSGRREQ
jgi:hypothetical protein